jgi:acyl dehydratase
MQTLFLEDFAPGQVHEVGPRAVTAAEIVEFARDYDPQPCHLDEAAAAQGPHGELVASAWQVGALAWRMVVDGVLRTAASLGSPGLERIEWSLPVRAGDLLTLRSTVKAVMPSRLRPDVGVVASRYELFNQDGDLVYAVDGAGLIRRRPA